MLTLSMMVTNAVSADRKERKTERDDAASTYAENAEIYAYCVKSPTTEIFAACVAEKAKTTREAKHDQADLRAQQDMASFAIGIYWWTILGFITSCLSVVALVGTFLAQQKLNRTQSRAYIEVQKLRAACNAEGRSVRFDVQLFNRGATPALDVQFFVYPRYYPPCDDTDAVVVEPPEVGGKFTYIAGTMSMLPVEQRRQMTAIGPIDFPLDQLSRAGAARNGQLPAVLRIDCVVTFRDAFGRRRRFSFRTGTSHIDTAATEIPIGKDDQFGVAAYVHNGPTKRGKKK